MIYLLERVRSVHSVQKSAGSGSAEGSRRRDCACALPVPVEGNALPVDGLDGGGHAVGLSAVSHLRVDASPAPGARPKFRPKFREIFAKPSVSYLQSSADLSCDQLQSSTAAIEILSTTFKSPLKVPKSSFSHSSVLHNSLLIFFLLFIRAFLQIGCLFHIDWTNAVCHTALLHCFVFIWPQGILCPMCKQPSNPVGAECRA